MVRAAATGDGATVGFGLDGTERLDGLGRREASAVRALADLPPHAVLRHEIHELERPVWGAGRVALLGDAAHAMTPNLGLGAGLAIEDAVVLTRVLAGTPDPVAAYRRARHARVRAVQLASRALGQLAHRPDATSTGVRRLLGLQA